MHGFEMLRNLEEGSKGVAYQQLGLLSCAKLVLAQTGRLDRVSCNLFTFLLSSFG